MEDNKMHPPYYAVIFTSTRTEGDNGYAEMADKMVELARQQPGFLGIESARDNELGITVSYWQSLEAIQSWKQNTEHTFARNKGRETWYKNFTTRICKVEREYSWDKEQNQISKQTILPKLQSL